MRLYTITRPDRFECVGRYETDYGYAKNVYINWGYYGYGDGYFNFNYLHVGSIHYNKNLKYIIATPTNEQNKDYNLNPVPDNGNGGVLM